MDLQACCFRGREASCSTRQSCATRQAPAVHFSSGEILLPSHSCAWNGAYASNLTHKLVFCALLSGPVGGNCSFVDRQFSVEFGEETTAQLLFPLGPVPSPGAISFSCAQLQGFLMPPRGEDLSMAVVRLLPMVGNGGWRESPPDNCTG